MAFVDTLINTLFDGRYRIVRKLGSGGMADVYLAEDEELGRRVAIKILNDRHANDESFVERFRREAKNAAGLSHPNIVSIYDRGEAEGTYYIAMEYLDGRSLKELVVARGPLPIGDAIEFTRQVLGALRFAHRKGVVHRDIKPHNVMADADGRLKVTDFGIARAGVSQMTEAGSIIGTAQYLSPEQARGAAVDQRSDLYSVGIVLYEMLTGTVPFTGDSPVEIAMKHLSDTAAAALAGAARHPARPGHDRAPRAREEPGRPLPDRRGDGRRARPGRPGRRRDGRDRGCRDGRPLRDRRSRTRRRRSCRLAARPPAAGPRYRYADPPARRRPVWPWLLALLLVVLAGVAGWYAFGQDPGHAQRLGDGLGALRRQRRRKSSRSPTSRRRGSSATVHREPNETRKEGQVFGQDPPGGVRLDKGGERRHLRLHGAAEGRSARREGQVTRRRDQHPLVARPGGEGRGRLLEGGGRTRSSPRTRRRARRWTRDRPSRSTSRRAVSR